MYNNSRILLWSAIVSTLIGCTTEVEAPGASSAALRASELVDHGVAVSVPHGPDPVFPAAFAVEPNGRAHVIVVQPIGEFSMFGSIVYHNVWNGSAWTSTELPALRDYIENAGPGAVRIEVDRHGTPHVVFTSLGFAVPEHAGTHYATVEDGEWSVTRLSDEMGSVDLDLDDAGVPHVLVFPWSGGEPSENPLVHFTQDRRGNWVSTDTGVHPGIYGGVGGFALARMEVSGRGPNATIHTAWGEGEFGDEQRVVYLRGGCRGRWTVEDTGLSLPIGWSAPAVAFDSGHAAYVALATPGTANVSVVRRGPNGRYVRLPDVPVEPATVFAFPMFVDRQGLLHISGESPDESGAIPGARWNGRAWTSESFPTELGGNSLSFVGADKVHLLLESRTVHEDGIDSDFHFVSLIYR